MKEGDNTHGSAIARVVATVEGPYVVAISVGAKAVDDEITLSE